MAQEQYSTPIEKVTGSLGSICSVHKIITNLCATCFRANAKDNGHVVLPVSTSILGKKLTQGQIVMFTAMTPDTATAEQEGDVLFLVPDARSGNDVVPVKRLRVFAYLEENHEGVYKILGSIGKNNIGLFGLGDDHVLKFIGNSQSRFEKEETDRKNICTRYAEKMKSNNMEIVCAVGDQVRINGEITCIKYPRVKGATVQEIIESCRTVPDRIKLSRICGAMAARFHLIPVDANDQSNLLFHGDFNASNILYSPSQNEESLMQGEVGGGTWSFVDNDYFKLVPVPKTLNQSSRTQISSNLEYDAGSLTGNLSGPMTSEDSKSKLLDAQDKVLIKQAFIASYMETWKASTTIPFDMKSA